MTSTRTIWRLKGHGRVVNPIGRAQGLRQPPPGGWSVGCRCGWTGQAQPVRAEAFRAYAAHLVTALPICKRCGETKSRRDMSRASTHLCKPCRVAATREWAEANPKAWDRHQRRYYLLNKYGITLEEADTLLARQGGACAICGRAENDSRGFRLHIDHCHTTGRVRGILCGSCNRGIGGLGDNPELVGRALDYLLRSQEVASCAL